LGESIDAQDEAVKDRLDDAITKGPKRADQYSGGRVMVGETGDLHDLAAKRHEKAWARREGMRLQALNCRYDVTDG
jgi:hypothetical protein